MKINFTCDPGIFTIEVDKSDIPEEIINDPSYFQECDGNLEGFITLKDKYLVRLITKN